MVFETNRLGCLLGTLFSKPYNKEILLKGIFAKVLKFSLVDAEALSTETLTSSVTAVARARWLLTPLLGPR